MKTSDPDPTAIWALTPGGARLARLLSRRIAGSTRFLSERVAAADAAALRFTRLKDEVHRRFADYPRHVFIMATGIVVRNIGDCLVHKTSDPAVVVCDENGQFAISLVSGHLGGANALAREVAGITGGRPVITTATDVNRVPAIDLIAVENRLRIENPAAIKKVNMALVTGDPIRVHDPYARVTPQLPPERVLPFDRQDAEAPGAGVFVDDIRIDLPPSVLVLRPATLVAGMGCNRGTAVGEMHDLLVKTFAEHHLALASLRALATVDLKADEPGILALVESLGIDLRVFSREQLKAVDQVPTPSKLVEKHIGVQSVCEAAALLATHRGRLIVPKQKTPNVTLAVAADGYISSASVPADRST